MVLKSAQESCAHDVTRDTCSWVSPGSSGRNNCTKSHTHEVKSQDVKMNSLRVSSSCAPVVKLSRISSDRAWSPWQRFPPFQRRPVSPSAFAGAFPVFELRYRTVPEVEGDFLIGYFREAHRVFSVRFRLFLLLSA